MLIFKCRIILLRSLFADFENKMKHGSYIASLGRERTLSLASVNYLRTKHWLDRHTAGVTLEFVVYNTDVNLGCFVQVFWHFPPGGGAKTTVNVNSLRVYRSTSSRMNVFVLIFELLYLLYTFYMIVREIRQIGRRKWRYFRSFSSLIDLTACAVSVVVMALYLTFLSKMSNLMSMYKRGEDIVGYFVCLVNLDMILSCAFGFLVLVGMLKFLHLLRFNPLMWRFMMIMQYAMPALICALSIIVVNFVAFGSFMHVVGGRSIENYSTMAKSLTTLYEGLLGIIYMDDLEQIDKFFGPFLYVVFLFVLTILVLNLNIIVLVNSLKHVAKHPMPNEETEILWLLIHKFVQYLGIRLRTH